MTSVYVRFPHFYWLACRQCFPHLTEDPDVTDKLTEPRHADKELINWAAVGSVVEGVGRKLVNGDFDLDPEDPEWAEVEVDFGMLSESEKEIVSHWFRHGVCPTGDLTDLVNGRHRLWNCWSTNPELLLPLESMILCATLEPPDSPVHDVLPCDAYSKLTRVTQSVAQISTAYVQKLSALAAGCDPSTVDADDYVNAEVVVEPPLHETPPKLGGISVLRQLLNRMCRSS